MATHWSVTYVEGAQVSGFANMGLVNTTRSLVQAASKMELRESTGQVLRLAKGAEFQLIDGPNGVVAETFGEVFLRNSVQLMHHKYRTSCYTCGKIGGTIIDLLMKNVGDNIDEFQLISGALSIYEFDENNKPFVICSLSEGEKAVMAFDPDAPTMRQRYSAKIEEMTDKEYDHIVQNYLDPRQWR